MQTLKEALIGFCIMLGIVWLAIFVVVLLDRIRGRSVSHFFGSGRYHLPHLPQSSLPWWHWVRLLLYCSVFLLFMWGCLLMVPPMFVIELSARLRARFSGGQKEPHHDHVA
jgi:hypothetical protein